MPDVKKTDAETAPVAEAQPAQVSKQRQFAATGASLVVSVALGAVASYFINKAATQVHNSINPPQTTEAPTDN